MRILVVSDLHYRLPHYDWLVEAADTWTRCVIAGDLADVVSPVPHEVQTVVISRYLGQLAERTTVFAASGNHDLDGPGHHGEQVARLAAERTARRGCTSTARQRRHRRHPVHRLPLVGRTDHPRRGRRPSWPRLPPDRPARWVWLYHAPPAGTPLCDDGRRTFPDHELAEWIAQHQPDLVLCGHIHQAPWVEGGSWHARLGETWVFNAGKQIGPVPPHITLDTEAATADWFGVFDSETIGCRSALSERGRPRGRGPSRSARAAPGGGPGGRGSASTMPRWPPASANCCLTSTRYCVRPSSREAVVRSTASAAPGWSVRNCTGSSTTRTSTSSAAAHRGRGWTFEHHRHLTEDRTRGVDACEGHPVVLHDDRARHQDEHPAGRVALVDERLARGHGAGRQVGAEGQQVRHPSSLGHLRPEAPCVSRSAARQEPS